jgi:glyoxylase-like metal-dependent hydrolase (beta-lactamase superfamily II)
MSVTSFSRASLAFVLLLVAGHAAAQRALPPMKIEQLTPHVYRYGGLTNGAFVVGSESIAVIDGQICGSNGTQWLKDELAKRFPGVPVKYTVLSHDHEMHICGLEVFSDTAVAISHVNAKGHIVREKRRTVTPQVTFDDRMELDLGGIEVVLFYLGPTHTDNRSKYTFRPKRFSSRSTSSAKAKASRCRSCAT